jgi:c-di-GMP-binding flagellar brake protein YcgR
MVWEGEEKRKFPRGIFLCKIAMSSTSRWLVTHTENISSGGVRVILEEKVNPFTNVELEIFFEKEKSTKFKGKVAWSRTIVNPIENEPLLYDTGIQFAPIDANTREYINRLVHIISSQERERKD